MRSGVPVVPIAVVGTEEIMPTLFRLPPGGEVGWPVTLNGVLFGPLGALALFPAKVRARVLEPVVFDQPPGLDRYPTSVVADAAEEIRDRMQAALADMVAVRRSPWQADVRRVLVTATDGPLGVPVVARLARRGDLDLVERLDTWEYGGIVDVLAGQRHRHRDPPRPPRLRSSHIRRRAGARAGGPGAGLPCGAPTPG